MLLRLWPTVRSVVCSSGRNRVSAEQANTFNLRSTRAGYGQGQHDQGERPAGFLALGWIGGLGRIAVAPFGVAGGCPAWPVLAAELRGGAGPPPVQPRRPARGGKGPGRRPRPPPRASNYATGSAPG